MNVFKHKTNAQKNLLFYILTLCIWKPNFKTQYILPLLQKIKYLGINLTNYG